MNSAPRATDPWASLTIVWSVVSPFTHVTVVPFVTEMIAGLNAKFWILTVAAPGACTLVVAGGVDGPLPVHPHIAMKVKRTTIRIDQ